MADARFVADVARVGGIVAGLLAQMPDLDAEIAGIVLGCRTQTLTQQMSVGDDRARRAAPEAG
jgi:hypothetical protein